MHAGKKSTRLAPYPTNENGLMIAANKPLEKSHRHYSHLLAFYPFRLLHPDVPENRKFLEKSIEHWLSLEDGKGLAGYSYTGAASLYAYLGNGNKAYERLAHFINKPIGISILLPNTFYVESQGKNPVIETPLSAAASLTELLIQSWDETIRIFPAVPDHWKDCAFHALEGGRRIYRLGSTPRRKNRMGQRPVKKDNLAVYSYPDGMPSISYLQDVPSPSNRWVMRPMNWTSKTGESVTLAPRQINKMQTTPYPGKKQIPIQLLWSEIKKRFARNNGMAGINSHQGTCECTGRLCSYPTDCRRLLGGRRYQ
ncbi:hypothetical protein NIB75_02370 [Bacteroides uniformis]|nr:hypothetical protein [Bacteroides uniformis]